VKEILERSGCDDISNIMPDNSKIVMTKQQTLFPIA
jgi:hypothetical protein